MVSISPGLLGRCAHCCVLPRTWLWGNICWKTQLKIHYHVAVGVPREYCALRVSLCGVTQGTYVLGCLSQCPFTGILVSASLVPIPSHLTSVLWACASSPVTCQHACLLNSPFLEWVTWADSNCTEASTSIYTRLSCLLPTRAGVTDSNVWGLWMCLLHLSIASIWNTEGLYKAVRPTL